VLQPPLGTLPDMVSAVVAFVALIVAARSNRIARAALAIARTKEAREQPRLVPYLSDAYSLERERHRDIEVSMSLSNPSDSNNSVARADLVVTHIVGGETLTRTIFSSAPAARADVQSEAKLLSPPIAIHAHGTIAGRLNFRLPHALIDRFKVREYEVQLTDAQGLVTKFQINSFHELSQTS
jgi:hypothetical protein